MDYYVRVAKSYDNDGEVFAEYYITTIADDGTEWVVNESTSEPEFPIGNTSADVDDVIACRVSWNEALELINK